MSDNGRPAGDLRGERRAGDAEAMADGCVGCLILCGMLLAGAGTLSLCLRLFSSATGG